MAVNKCNITKYVLNKVNSLIYGIRDCDIDSDKAILENYLEYLNCTDYPSNSCYPDNCPNPIINFNCNFNVIGIIYSIPAEEDEEDFDIIFYITESQYVNGLAPFTYQWTFDTDDFEVVGSSTAIELKLNLKDGKQLDSLVSQVIIQVTDANNCRSTKSCWFTQEIMQCNQNFVPCVNPQLLVITPLTNQFELNWDNSEVNASANALNQRASYRQKSVGGAFITTGFTPTNDMSKTVDSATTANSLLSNLIYEFKVECLCTVGGPTINDNGIQEMISFECIEPSTNQTHNAASISIDVTGTDITKATITLKKQSDDSTVYSQTIDRVADLISTTANGLTASTGYYWEYKFITILNGIEYTSISTCGEYSFNTTAIPDCLIPGSLSIDTNGTVLEWTPNTNGNTTAQRANKRIKTVGGAFITTGFAPSNNLSLVAITTTSTGTTKNKVYEYKIENLCTVGGPTPNSVVESISFQCIVPTIQVSGNNIEVTVNLVNTDIIKITFTLKKQSDDTIAGGPETVSKTANVASFLFEGLEDSTGYYIEYSMIALVNGVETSSSGADYLNTICGGNIIGYRGTTTAAICAEYTLSNPTGSPIAFSYNNCSDNEVINDNLGAGDDTSICAKQGSVDIGEGIVLDGGVNPCSYLGVINRVNSTLTSSINSVSGLFSIPYIGTYPVNSDSILEAIHSGTLSPITVNVSNTTNIINLKLRLYRNGVLQETKNVNNGTDNYVFAAITISVGDTVYIVLEGTSSLINWTYQEENGGQGNLTIKVNTIALVNATTTSSAGALYVTPGNSIEISVTGAGGDTKTLDISASPGGVIFTGSGLGTQTHTYVAVIDTVYTVDGTVTTP